MTLAVRDGDYLEKPTDSKTSKSSLRIRPDTTLTLRELEVLQLIVDGKSNAEIASELGLSPNTVGVHRSNIMRTVGFHKTAQLVVYAIREGLVEIR